MSSATAGKLLAQAILQQVHITDRRRLARLSVVVLLILLTAIYPNWLFTAITLAAIIRMAVLNRREALAVADTLATLLYASETPNDKEHPDD